jgi:hypothetical protein
MRGQAGGILIVTTINYEFNKMLSLSIDTAMRRSIFCVYRISVAFLMLFFLAGKFRE